MNSECRHVPDPGAAEVRTEWKARADEAAIDTFERTLRNLLLGPVGGPRKTLGVQPDARFQSHSPSANSAVVRFACATVSSNPAMISCFVATCCLLLCQVIVAPSRSADLDLDTSDFGV